jgi:hypothetical protein
VRPVSDIATAPFDPDDDILPDWMFDDEELQGVEDEGEDTDLD